MLMDEVIMKMVIIEKSALLNSCKV